MVIDLISGLALMLLVPYAHLHLSTPDLHPGYLTCVVLVFLAGAVSAAFRPVPVGD